MLVFVLTWFKGISATQGHGRNEGKDFFAGFLEELHVSSAELVRAGKWRHAKPQACNDACIDA